MDWDTIETTITQLQEEWRTQRDQLWERSNSPQRTGTDLDQMNQFSDKIQALWELKERLEQTKSTPLPH